MSEVDPVGRDFLPIVFAFPFFPYSNGTKKAKMSMELKPTDLGGISSVLEHVYLPVVLGNIQNDALLVWNSAFQKRVGLSESELACTSFASLLILEESARNSITQGDNAEHHDTLLPCVLKTPLTNVYGQALRCDDGMLLAMLDVTLWDLASKGFDQGLRMGCEEERNRTRHFFHDVLSSKILVASFLAHEIHQKLAASGAEEAEDMARLTKLLQEAIEAIVRGAEKY
jgi:hypothetical protein